MYLSRIPLDISKRKTQVALVSPNKFHGAIEEAFAERQCRNLWRIDNLKGRTYLLLLSESEPDLEYIAGQFGDIRDCGETKGYEALLNRIREGSVWHFRLVANPTYSKRKGEGRGKVTAHTVEEFQLQWLAGQSVKKGFRIVPDTVRVMESKWKIFNKRDMKHKIRILEAAFEGRLEVENEEVFKDTLITGIGREKAYGMGLLTIAGNGG